MSDQDQTRGQMLLLFAVLLGVLLIVGAGALNLSAIASQERSGGMDTPTTTSEEVYAEVTTIGDATLRDVNCDPSITENDDRRERIRNQLETTYELLQVHLGQTETAVSYSIEIGQDAVTDGARVVQSAPGNVTSASGDPDWEPIQDASDVRELTMAAETLNELPTSTSFRVILETGTGDEVVIEIQRADNDSDNLEIGYTNAQGGQSEAFMPVSDPFLIDFVGGTVDKAHLPEYYPVEEIESVRIENGDAVDDVTYSMVATEDADISNNVQTAPSPVTTTSEEHTPSEPLTHPAIYQVMIEVETVGAHTQSSQTLVLGDSGGGR